MKIRRSTLLLLYLPTLAPTSAFLQTSRLIESAAVTIIKMLMRNREQAHVYCSVQSNAMDILGGTVEGASVGGRNWQSPLGLTCRTLDANVGTISVDLPGLLRQQLRLTRPALGSAKISFDDADFENLLLHPAVGSAPIAGNGQVFEFARGDCKINAAERTITMAGLWAGERKQVQLRHGDRGTQLAARVLQRELAAAAVGAQSGASVRRHQQPQQQQAESSNRALAAGVARYFQELTLDLDGVSLRYADMEFLQNPQGRDTVMLLLDVVIRKAPDVGKLRF